MMFLIVYVTSAAALAAMGYGAASALLLAILGLGVLLTERPA